MIQKRIPAISLLIILILSITVLSACSSSKGTSAETGTGVVTETTMTDTVESSGSVNARQIATLAWGTSGNILEINVVANDKVTGGDILMRLDPQTAPAEVIQAVSTLVTAQQNLITARESKTSIAEAELALLDAKDAYDQALGQTYTLGKPVGSEDYIAILKANVIKAQEAVDRAEKNYAGFAETPDGDSRKAASRAALSEARIALKKATSTYNYYTSTPNAMDSASIQANLNLAKAKLDDAQRTFDLLKDGNNTNAITSAQAAVDAAQATVNKLSIIAPFDGEVAVVYSQVGDVISSGTKALVLVDRSKMYVDVAVDETSISRVKAGNPAEITFDALNGLSTTGKVSLIDPIGVSSSGVINYTVRVELDKTDPEVLIGATATVVINTGEPQSVLFVPVSAVLSDAQGEYVMRLTNSGTVERVTIVSGQIVDESVVVVGDLKKGDSVQLYNSSSSASSEDQATSSFGMGGEMRGSGGAEPPSGGSVIPMP